MDTDRFVSPPVHWYHKTTQELGAGAVEADQTHNCHTPSGTGESRSIFSVLFFVLLSFFMCGVSWPLTEQNGFWSFNILVFVRIECGAWPLE